MPFTAQHEITKRLVSPPLHHRHFFRIEDRPQSASLVYISLLDEAGVVYMKYRVSIAKIKENKAFKTYKSEKFFGHFWIDTDPVVKLPASYLLEVQGLFAKSESHHIVSSGKFEDLTKVSTLEKLMQKHGVDDPAKPAE